MKNRDQYENPMFLPHAIETIKNLSKYYNIYPLSDCRNNFDLKNSGRIFKGKFELLYRTFSQKETVLTDYINRLITDMRNCNALVKDIKAYQERRINELRRKSQ